MRRFVEDFFWGRRREDTLFLPFFRVTIALFCLLHFCSIWNDVQMLYGKEGLVPAEVGSLLKTSWIPSFDQMSSWLYISIGMDESSSIGLFKAMYVMASLSLAVGLASRPSAVLLLFLHLVLSKGTPLYAYGVDYFKTISLFYCVLFPVGRQFSVNSLIFGINSVIPNPAPFRRVLQLHLCFVYFFSGFDKLIGYNWRNGEAIWKALHLPYFNTDFGVNMDAFSAYPIVFVLLGWSVILIELCYPFFIFSKKTRSLWLALTVALHLGILIALNLYFFATLMIILNLSGFMDLSVETKRKTVFLLPRLKYFKNV